MSDLIQTMQVWGKTPMHADDLLIYNGCHWQAVETICEDFPDTHIKPTLAFIIKSIDSVYRCTFMIPSQKKEVLRILNLIGQQKAYCFKALLPSINIIT